MKRFVTIVLIIVLFLPATAISIVPGTVRQRLDTIGRDHFEVLFFCNGNNFNGQVPDTDIEDHITSKIQGWYLYSVLAYPTSGGTAPGTLSVMLYDSDGLDLLGSEDGGTTAYAGLALIHPTLKREAIPNVYLPRAGLHVNHFPVIRGTLTLDVNAFGVNVADSNYTIVLKIMRVKRLIGV